MSDDPQDAAEALDDDTIRTADVEDDAVRSGDDVGDAYADFPPDEPLAVDDTGVTPVEEDARESLAERVEREEPDTADVADGGADAADADESGAVAAEEAAMHVEPER